MKNSEHKHRKVTVNTWPKIFDQIFVISLPESQDRRQYIGEHLKEVGLVPFDYHDATGSKGQIVEQYISDGKVLSYPPCFRCGKNECGRDDCNNILIAPQIATFITYLRLWKKISDRNIGRTLILEDDVRFHSNVASSLARIANRIDSGHLQFCASQPTLLRLGWALSWHHRIPLPFFVNRVIRMSNPCHAITLEFANRLLSSFLRIDTTVDIYQHERVASGCFHATVYPPIASELSWSTGEFESLIHPKMKRISYLARSGKKNDSKKASDQIRIHVQHKIYRPILIVGHPRCGSGFAADICQQLGLDVGHEKMGKHGISSWMFSVDDPNNPYALNKWARTRLSYTWKYMIFHTRNLKDAIPGVIRDSQNAVPNFRFRAHHILRLTGVDLEQYSDPVSQAIMSIVKWADLVMDQDPDFVFRIEDQAEELREFLNDCHLVSDPYLDKCLDIKIKNEDRPYGGVHVPKPALQPGDFESVSNEIRAHANDYCEHFGYLPLYY